MDFSLVVPTYNESANIRGLLDELGLALNGLDYEIVVVDDDSPDRTWELADRYSADHPRVRVIRRTTERGLATAVIAGWRAAKGRYLAVIDGDGQHPPEAIRRIFDRMAAGDVDLVAGTRKSSGGSTGEWNLWRVFVSWVATMMAKVLFPIRLQGLGDPMGGMFCMRREVVRGKVLSPIGYKIMLEAIIRGRPARMEEVPYTFLERKAGASKMGMKEIFRYLVHLLRMRFLPAPKAGMMVG